MATKNNILMKRYELGRMLGQGSFAKVYYGKNLATGQGVAIKVINKEKIVKTGLMNQIKREISIMNLVRHPNVINLEEVMASKTKIYFVMEYAKGGELFNKVAEGRLEENVARKYFQQLISAVSFCHSRGVYHRDLKPENLLLDENGDLKVSDFGLGALSESKRQDGLLHTTCGTPAYVAPEVITRRGYDGAKTDTWSCGVILFVLLAGHLPFYNRNLMELYKKIAKSEYTCPHWFPTEARRLIATILDPNPNTRISIARIMENPWFCKDLNPIEAGTKAEEEDEEKPYTQSDMELARPGNLNAFDIISLSAGFDLSGLFVSKEEKDEVQFTSMNSASCIVSKLEDVAHELRFKVKKKDQGSFRLQGCEEVMKDRMSIDIEIFEISPCLHIVEMKRSSGDLVEYQHLVRQNIRPSLDEVVWSWQGEQHHSLI